MHLTTGDDCHMSISATLVGLYVEILSGLGMAGRCTYIGNLSLCTLNLIYPGWLLPCLLEIHEMCTDVLVCISCFSGRQENRGSNPGRIRGLSLLPSVQTGSGIHASTADSTSS